MACNVLLWSDAGNLYGLEKFWAFLRYYKVSEKLVETQGLDKSLINAFTSTNTTGSSNTLYKYCRVKQRLKWVPS